MVIVVPLALIVLILFVMFAFRVINGIVTLAAVATGTVIGLIIFAYKKPRIAFVSFAVVGALSLITRAYIS